MVIVVVTNLRGIGKMTGNGCLLIVDSLEKKQIDESVQLQLIRNDLELTSTRQSHPCCPHYGARHARRNDR